MAEVKEEDDNVKVVPNELSQSVDDPRQSESLNLTIRLNNDLGRKCYVDPHEAFPQATYYLNTNLKRPNYYLKKEAKFNKKILIHGDQPSVNISEYKSPKNKKQLNNNNNKNVSKMEVESESDDDDDDDDEEPYMDNDDDDPFEADDELFSASDVNMPP
eukprot:502074_1